MDDDDSADRSGRHRAGHARPLRLGFLRFDLVAPAVGRAITRSGIIDLALQRVLRGLTSPLILWSWPL